MLIMEAEGQRKLLLEVTRKIRSLSQDIKYAEKIRLLRTVPGIGFASIRTASGWNPIRQLLKLHENC